MLRLCGCLGSGVSDVGQSEEAIENFSVLCKFKNVADQFECAFTGVYGPNCVRVFVLLSFFSFLRKLMS